MGHDVGMQESPSPSGQRPRLTPSEFVDRLDTAAEQFAAALAGADLEAPVPTCPGWTLTDLAAHLGEIHQWAEHAIVAGNPDAQTIPEPAEPAALVQWYRDAARALSATLRATDPQSAAWTFGPKPRTASFWFRRQAHETTIHLWDAQVAQGDPEPIESRLALDGIEELITLFLPRQVRLGRTGPLERALALEPTDGPDRWVLTGDGTGPGCAADAPAEATVSGPAETLLLLLWGRVSLDDAGLAVSGDESAAHAALSATLTP
jgi:uncharacterized protein (TIGR03083 family)